MCHDPILFSLYPGLEETKLIHSAMIGNQWFLSHNSEQSLVLLINVLIELWQSYASQYHLALKHIVNVAQKLKTRF